MMDRGVKTLFYWLTLPLKRLFAHLGRRRVEEFTLQPVSLPAKVICVGNLTLGGTGKSPTVLWIARQIKKMHPEMKVGVHLRGYKGEMEHVGGIVSDGKKIYAGPKEAGDEAYLLASELLSCGIPVGVGKHKIEAGMGMVQRFGLDVIIFDDAYQFTSLKRDLNIVLIDALRPFGEAGFPREGVMREPLESLNRADLVLLTRTELVGGGDIRGIVGRITPFLHPGVPVFLSTFIPKNIVALKTGIEADRDVLLSRRALPLSAIGNPRGFELLLEKMGLSTVKPIRFTDHHIYNRKDIEYINRQTLERGAHVILTTEKDAVRFGRLLNEIEAPVYCVQLDFKMQKEPEFLMHLNQVLHSCITVKHSKSTPIIDPLCATFNVREDLERIAAGKPVASRVKTPQKIGLLNKSESESLWS